PAFEQVVVAEVTAVEAHPDADKLRICQVNDGSGEVLQIVCGAANVAAGMRVPLARIGAVLPNGMKIKPAKLRSVESSGMLCSAVELGLAEQADGLMPLPADAPVGDSIRDYLQLDDAIIDVDLTPNRGDCLSILGIAREVAALNGIAAKSADFPAVEAQHDESHAVGVTAEAACSRYAGRLIRGIDATANTPQWMVERLRRSGIRAIHPVVDVTNYVMLELGQPMHAFDHALLQGDIDVRWAKDGEKLQALTGEALELSEQDLVIADGNGPVALAGVVGGEPTSVSANTQDIFLESACFTPKALAGTARRHKLHTDSSHRFERGVDPAQQLRAIERATQLIVDICGGQPGPVVEAGSGTPDKAPVPLRLERAKRLLGFDLTATQIEATLQALEMGVESSGENAWQVCPPSYRYDINIEPDLIEEIVRIIGYDNLPTRPQEVVLPAVQQTETRLDVSRLREALIQRDYHEAVTYSFVDPEQQSKLMPQAPAIDLDNPIARQLGQMRTSLWSSLLPALLHNQQRQQDRVRLFEIGLKFIRGEGADIEQRQQLAGLVSGPRLSEQWSAKDARSDFYDVKADVEALLSLGGMTEEVYFVAAEHSALHPGQSARIERAGQAIGWLGVLHPSLLPVYDLNNSPVLFELDFAALLEAAVPTFEMPSEYPAMRRDLALLAKEETTASELLATVKQANESLLVDVQLFDVYRGEGLPSGCKSVALSLIFQDKSRTLKESEVEGAVKRLESRLDEQLGATIRG
ncbi:MAG: phenylalanine--tRNA ligase subunit beta, partial [Salinisphaeraceae bacterium]|nr:phenylalanine--tRNA ligase subunit beta [Salinisphaeraceae bacterium]